VKKLTTSLIILGSLASQAAVPKGGGADDPRPVKALIISMFGPEGQPWIDNLALSEEIAIPGLSPDYPAVHCNGDDVCQVTTGMGHSNVAATISALVFNPKFDFSRSYFLIAGIAGIDPTQGTLGSAAWARYLIDFGIAWELDAANWDITPASEPPAVVQCDTAGGDTWWHGALLEKVAQDWTKLLTDGAGTYCTTQQEDNSTYEALKRGASAGLLDIERVAVLRTASNFDRPYPGQTAYDSLVNSISGGFVPATQNLYNAGGPLIAAIVSDWDSWRGGVP